MGRAGALPTELTAQNMPICRHFYKNLTNYALPTLYKIRRKRILDNPATAIYGLSFASVFIGRCLHVSAWKLGAKPRQDRRRHWHHGLGVSVDDDPLSLTSGRVSVPELCEANNITARRVGLSPPHRTQKLVMERPTITRTAHRPDNNLTRTSVPTPLELTRPNISNRNRRPLILRYRSRRLVHTAFNGVKPRRILASTRSNRSASASSCCNRSANSAPINRSVDT